MSDAETHSPPILRNSGLYDAGSCPLPSPEGDRILGPNILTLQTFLTRMRFGHDWRRNAFAPKSITILGDYDPRSCPLSPLRRREDGILGRKLLLPKSLARVGFGHE